jgi:RsiW-degrading membrane proteinase PrsW (M82 family)
MKMTIPQDSKLVVSVHRPSVREKFFFFISGVIISVPLTLLVERFSGSLCVALPVFYATLCSTAIFAPLIEEFAKAYPLFYRHGETERSIFTLGFLVGLGFGISEFLVYVFALGVPIPLRVPGIFFHAASVSITAYGIATKRPIQFYLIAVALHFSNNFSAMFGPFWIIGGVAATVITYIISWRLYRKTSERMIES